MKINEVTEGDCIQVMQSLTPNFINLVFADPPFNIGYKYDKYKDSLNKNEYINFTKKWMSEVHRALTPNGSFYVAIGDEYAAHVKLVADSLGMTLRNWIIWHYTFGVNCKNKFARSHTHILYYVKDPEYFTFNVDSIRVPSKRATVYNDKRAHAKGKVPDDVWDFSRVCGTFKERTDHPCQMPEAVLERIVKASSLPGDIVLDPFAGSGTTLAVCKKFDRNFIGIELSSKYVNLIKERLSKT